jgi:hypothetical protein
MSDPTIINLVAQNVNVLTFSNGAEIILTPHGILAPGLELSWYKILEFLSSHQLEIRPAISIAQEARERRMEFYGESGYSLDDINYLEGNDPL